MVVYEGLHTYGGLAGATWRRMAIGIERVACRTTTSASRIGQVRYLGDLLIDWNIPIVQPVGGHAVFLDAAALLPAPPAGRSSRPDAGGASCISTRASGRWSAASPARGATRVTGEHHYPKLELTRLTIPRRVYTQAHMDVVAESVKAVCDARGQPAGCG